MKRAIPVRQNRENPMKRAIPVRQNRVSPVFDVEVLICGSLCASFSKCRPTKGLPVSRGRRQHRRSRPGLFRRPIRFRSVPHARMSLHMGTGPASAQGTRPVPAASHRMDDSTTGFGPRFKRGELAVADRPDVKDHWT